MSDTPEQDRRSGEVNRLWKAIHGIEAGQEAQDKERDAIERQVSGLSWAVFGLPQVPDSGLVNEIPKRFKDVDEKLDSMASKLDTNNRAIWAVLGSAAIALGVQVLIHYT